MGCSLTGVVPRKVSFPSTEFTWYTFAPGGVVSMVTFLISKENLGPKHPLVNTRVTRTVSIHAFFIVFSVLDAKLAVSCLLMNIFDPLYNRLLRGLYFRFGKFAAKTLIFGDKRQYYYVTKLFWVGLNCVILQIEWAWRSPAEICRRKVRAGQGTVTVNGRPG